MDATLRSEINTLNSKLNDMLMKMKLQRKQNKVGQLQTPTQMKALNLPTLPFQNPGGRVRRMARNIEADIRGRV